MDNDTASIKQYGTAAAVAAFSTSISYTARQLLCGMHSLGHYPDDESLCTIALQGVHGCG